MNRETKNTKYLVPLFAAVSAIVIGIVRLVQALNLARDVAMANTQLLPVFHEISDRVILSCVLITLSMAIIILMLQNDHSSNEGMKERMALLEKEKETMQEVAHHQRLEMIGTMTSSFRRRTKTIRHRTNSFRRRTKTIRHRTNRFQRRTRNI